MAEINFDELLAKRAQREQDKTKVCQIPIPDTDKYLVATMPSDYKIIQWLGMIKSGESEDNFKAFDDAIYTCCKALQDKKLHEQIDAKIPSDVVPKLFNVDERNRMAYDVLKFVGIFKDNEDDENDKESEDMLKN